MKLIKKRILLLVLLVFVLMVTSCKKYSHEFETDQKTDATKENMCLITAGENQWYTSAIIPERYIVLMDVEGGTNLVEKCFYKSFFINIYSLETKELVKTSSIKELEKGVPAVFYIDPGRPLGFRSEGQDYLRIKTSCIGKNPDQTTIFYLIINVDTGEMSFVDSNTYYDDFQENSEKYQGTMTNCVCFWVGHKNLILITF